MERTLAIIKPDGVRKGLIGPIIAKLTEERLKVVAMRMIHMSKREAEGFYYVHSARPFFSSLSDFMTSGPCLVMVLAGDEAIARYRVIMGATNPEDAAEGTIRKMYADNIENNIVHGSDAPETAEFEISYFFNGLQVF